MMNRTKEWIRQWQYPLFVLLAIAFSWWSVPIMDGALLPHGPFIAAAIVLALTAGRAGLAGLGRQLIHWRVSWWWYLLAPGMIAAIAAGAVVLNILLGASIATTAHLNPSALALTLGILLLAGGQWEEPGWSGYVLPFGEERPSRGLFADLLPPSLLAFLPRLLWHLPLVLAGTIPWYDALLYGLAFQLIIARLHKLTSRSLPVVMLFHLSSNFFFGGMTIPMFTGADLSRFYWLFIGLTWLAAAIFGYLTAEKRPALAFQDGAVAEPE